MTNKEAIEILRANYPDACFGQLREAVDAAIEALKAQNVAGDTISRQAAIDAVKDWYDGLICGSFKGLKKRLEALPSAQPEIIRCKDCRWRKDQSGSTAWLPCRAIVTPSDFYCGRAERRTDG